MVEALWVTVKIFLDKKNFSLDQSFNHCNDCYLAKAKSDVQAIMTTKHPASVMVLGIMTSNGKKMPPFFFPCRLRVGAKEYLEMLQTCTSCMNEAGVGLHDRKKQ